jgi:hypothetical protein
MVLHYVQLLSQQVDPVSHVLESVVGVVVVLGLLNELFNVVKGTLVELSGLLHEPFSRHLVPLSDNCWKESFDLLDISLWSGSNLASCTLGIKLNQSNVSCVWQLGSEQIVVVVEQRDSVVEIVYWVLQSLVDQYLKINLGITPVYFENGLEPPLESLHLLEGTLEDGSHHFFVSDMKRMLGDPCIRIQCQFLGLFPGISDDWIPLFKCIGVWQKVVMLAPPFEL